VIGAEADAERAQAGAGILLERLDLVGNLAPLDDAEIFRQAERQPARRRR
jgi:hypothetical protein